MLSLTNGMSYGGERHALQQVKTSKCQLVNAAAQRTMETGSSVTVRWHASASRHHATAPQQLFVTVSALAQAYRYETLLSSTRGSTPRQHGGVRRKGRFARTLVQQ
jgi:hypothetical protein